MNPLPLDGFLVTFLLLQLFFLCQTQRKLKGFWEQIWFASVLWQQRQADMLVLGVHTDLEATVFSHIALQIDTFKCLLIAGHCTHVDIHYLRTLAVSNAFMEMCLEMCFWFFTKYFVAFWRKTLPEMVLDNLHTRKIILIQLMRLLVSLRMCRTINILYLTNTPRTVIEVTYPLIIWPSFISEIDWMSGSVRFLFWSLYNLQKGEELEFKIN